jgi:nucleoid-associated protein YgaU
MALTEKYQSLIDLANSLGISGLNVQDDGSVLKIDGVAGSADAKQQLFDEYSRLDPDMGSGDLVMTISAPEAADTTYTVQSGDSLSKIGSHYGVSWHAIFEANKDQISDPDVIHPGQQLKIPQG